MSFETAAPGGFEGPEKVVEIELVNNIGPDNGRGLRNLSKEDWEGILHNVKCNILDSLSNEYVQSLWFWFCRHFDAYILSESSLFVYPYKCIIKTCGTIALLLVLPILRRSIRVSLSLFFLCFLEIEDGILMDCLQSKEFPVPSEADLSPPEHGPRSMLSWLFVDV